MNVNFVIPLDTLSVPFAMRTSIGAILIVVAVGLVICGVVRVIADAIAWYKDDIMDPYRDLRKEAREARKPKKTLEDVVGRRRVAQDENSADRI